jgi:phospholipid/cholesterol/gamma-HCH transport system permease protein
MHSLGAYCLKQYSDIARFGSFCNKILSVLFKHGVSMSKLLVQIERIGLESLNIVLLTGTFSGMVFALQSYIGFSRIGGQQFIGSVVALGMARELGPVLTGLMVTGRVCSAIAAELGTMRITEQIDAMITLHINTFSYLIIPRILASIIALPCLTLFAIICGIGGGRIVVEHVLHLNPQQYLTNITQFTHMADIIGGLIKSCFFGIILASIGCYKGYYAHGGARGVGRATTQAVVLSSVMILITNYFLTKLLECL